MNLKAKLTLVLSLLLASNAAYFYAGVGTIDRLDEIARTLYDRVVMSGTYSQMVKNDFHRYSGLLTSLVLVSDGDARAEVDAQIEDAAQTFRDDLAVVRERTMNPEDIVVVDEIGRDFAALEAARDHAGHAAPLARVAEWMNSAERRDLLTKISDLTDKVVADGYAYRLGSVERARQLRRASILASILILILNVAALGFVLASVLPRLRRLTEICVDIARGNFGKRVQFKARDEFGELAEAFNTMLAALNESEGRVAAQLVTTNAMVDGLGQGFLMIGPDGVCLPVFSNACLDLLGRAPGGEPAWRALGVPEAEAGGFADWLSLMFDGVSTFEALAMLGPEYVPHADGRVVTLGYRASRDQAGALRAVVVVATDRTAEVRAKDEAEREHEFSRMVVKLMRNRSEFTRFLVAAREMIAALTEGSLEVRVRKLHTLKGGAATYALTPIKVAAHEWETRLAGARDFEREAELARADLDTKFGELLDLLREQCDFTLAESGLTRELSVDALTTFQREIADPSLRHRFALAFLTEPARDIFKAFDETIRDVSAAQGKSVFPLAITGGDVAVLRSEYGDLFESLVHVFRNAVDHGIELPDERAARGKVTTATIRVAVERTADLGLRVEIEDDGRGVDATKLRHVLQSRGVDVSDEDDETLIQHVFDARVSTRDHVTDISGRGVGLDAVRAAARALGGDARVTSRPGQGTRVLILIPPVVSIRDALPKSGLKRLN